MNISRLQLVKKWEALLGPLGIPSLVKKEIKVREIDILAKEVTLSLFINQINQGYKEYVELRNTIDGVSIGKEEFLRALKSEDSFYNKWLKEKLKINREEFAGLFEV